jgi:hypothetical protein
MIARIIYGSIRPIQRYVEENDDSTYNSREHQTWCSRELYVLSSYLQHSVGLVLPWIIRAIIIFLNIALYGCGAPVDYTWGAPDPYNAMLRIIMIARIIHGSTRPTLCCKYEWVWWSRRLFVLSSYLQHSVGLVLPWIIRAIIIFLNIALYGSSAPLNYTFYHHFPQHSVVWVWCSLEL